MSSQLPNDLQGELTLEVPSGVSYVLQFNQAALRSLCKRLNMEMRQVGDIFESWSDETIDAALEGALARHHGETTREQREAILDDAGLLPVVQRLETAFSLALLGPVELRRRLAQGKARPTPEPAETASGTGTASSPQD